MRNGRGVPNITLGECVYII